MPAVFSLEQKNTGGPLPSITRLAIIEAFEKRRATEKGEFLLSTWKSFYIHSSDHRRPTRAPSTSAGGEYDYVDEVNSCFIIFALLAGNEPSIYISTEARLLPDLSVRILH